MLNTPRIFVRKKTMSPCYGCEDRQVGCHSSCEKYVAYKKATLEEYVKIRNAYAGERRAEAVEVEKRVENARRNKAGGKKYFTKRVGG